MRACALVSHAQYRLALLGAALVASLLPGCSKKEAAEKSPAAQAKTQSAQVTAVAAGTKTLAQKVEVTGALNTLNDVTVGAKVAGKIVAVYFREGDHVTQGQVVAEQDAADLHAQYDQAYANYLGAQSRLAQARTTLSGAITTLQYTRDQTAAAIKSADAALRAAKEQAAIVKQGARRQEREQAVENRDAAKADRDRARADLDRAGAEERRTAADLKRYQDLAKQDAIAPQQLDQARAASESATAAYTSAQAAYTSADARYRSAIQALSLIEEGSRPEDIRRAQASVDQAAQALATAQSNSDQIKMRADDVENARAGVRVAEATVKQTKAAVDLAQQGLVDARLVSPITGVVAERKVEPGMQLGAGKDAMRIVALNTIYFDAQLSEGQYAQVRVGQPVDVRVDALPNAAFKGTIAKIFPVASATARSFTVRITIPNTNNQLRPNLFARGSITTAVHKNAVIVPSEAVLNNTGKEGRLFVLNGDKAEERKVTLGIATIHEIEVTAGVKPGEKVVTVGQGQIQNGDKVQLSGQAEPTARE